MMIKRSLFSVFTLTIVNIKENTAQKINQFWLEYYQTLYRQSNGQMIWSLKFMLTL